MSLGLGFGFGAWQGPSPPPAGPSDPFFSNVKALLHFDGANGGSTFTDQLGHTFTSVGSPTTSTAQSKYGGASGLFPAGVSGVTCTHADFVLAGNFTIECWVYPIAFSGYNGLFETFANSSARPCYIDSTGKVTMQYNTAVLSASALPLSTWTHVAVTRSGSTMRLFLGGVLNGTDSTTFVQTTTSKLSIASCPGFPATLSNNLMLDDFRYTVGVARYTANFTPPTSAFPDQ